MRTEVSGLFIPGWLGASSSCSSFAIRVGRSSFASCTSPFLLLGAFRRLHLYAATEQPAVAIQYKSNVCVRLAIEVVIIGDT